MRPYQLSARLPRLDRTTGTATRIMSMARRGMQPGVIAQKLGTNRKAVECVMAVAKRAAAR